MNITAECVKESDGYHAHRFEIPKPDATYTIEDHRHAWTDEHQARWPDSRRVTIHRGRYYEPVGGHDTLELAWKALGIEEPIPTCACS